VDQAERQAKIEFILEHYEHPYRHGAVDDASVIQKGGNPGCGDIVTVYLQIDDEGRITDLSFEGEGCTISQAGTSIVMEMFEDKTVEDIENTAPEAILDLLGREIASTRLRCATLGITTAKEAVRAWRRRRVES
jgi:nitrogen fixation NifU-like protein